MITEFGEKDSAELLSIFASQYSPGFLDTDAGMSAARAEIHERQYWFRVRYIPWIETVIPLNGTRVLEVGTGNGSSTVCFALPGAKVDGIDVKSAGLGLARHRAKILGVGDRIRLQEANATDISSLFASEQFDLIVYTASVEHMTFAERVATLSSAWAMLNPGGILSILDTPNRLWYFDNHTSFANFFHWLPDDVAVAYAKYVTREGLADDVEGAGGQERLARWGRGVSYHDLAVALESDPGQFYASGEWDYRRTTDPDWATWWSTTDDGAYYALLRKICPELPSGFLEPELAICLRKP